MRIYEHAKTGEVFVIPDPELKLAQVEEVQMQVAGLLSPPPPPPAPEPTPDPDSAQVGE